jgi:hypothetical protein
VVKAGCGKPVRFWQPLSARFGTRNDGAPSARWNWKHYPGMTEKAIEAVLDAASMRFDIFLRRV